MFRIFSKLTSLPVTVSGQFPPDNCPPPPLTIFPCPGKVWVRVRVSWTDRTVNKIVIFTKSSFTWYYSNLNNALLNPLCLPLAGIVTLKVKTEIHNELSELDTGHGPALWCKVEG